MNREFNKYLSSLDSQNTNKKIPILAFIVFILGALSLVLIFKGLYFQYIFVYKVIIPIDILCGLLLFVLVDFIQTLHYLCLDEKLKFKKLFLHFLTDFKMLIFCILVPFLITFVSSRIG